jgi:hypothetical protein
MAVTAYRRTGAQVTTQLAVAMQFEMGFAARRQVDVAFFEHGTFGGFRDNRTAHLFRPIAKLS